MSAARFFKEWNDFYRPKGSSLVYNTGRPLHSVMRLIHEGRIEVPDALVCSEVNVHHDLPPANL